MRILAMIVLVLAGLVFFSFFSVRTNAEEDRGSSSSEPVIQVDVSARCFSVFKEDKKIITVPENRAYVCAGLSSNAEHIAHARDSGVSSTDLFEIITFVQKDGVRTPTLSPENMLLLQKTLRYVFQTHPHIPPNEIKMCVFAHLFGRWTSKKP